MTQTTTRRDLLRIGTSAAAYAAGVAIVTGGVALASGAKGATGITPTLASLMARYHLAYATYERVCEDVSDPARDRWREAVSSARASVPHIEMSFDMSGVPHSDEAIRTYTTANRLHLAAAAASCSIARLPAHRYTSAQHRLFAFKTHFHEAGLEREARVAAAVAEADRSYGISAEAAQENAAWDVVSDCGSAVIECQPRSFADLSAKLAFYKATSVVPDEALLEHVMADVAALGASVAQEGR